MVQAVPVAEGEGEDLRGIGRLMIRLMESETGVDESQSLELRDPGCWKLELYV